LASLEAVHVNETLEVVTPLFASPAGTVGATESALVVAERALDCAEALPAASYALTV
jgi:hypothetical protein